jgi:hypothetical protein
MKVFSIVLGVCCFEGCKGWHKKERQRPEGDECGGCRGEEEEREEEKGTGGMSKGFWRSVALLLHFFVGFASMTFVELHIERSTYETEI